MAQFGYATVTALSQEGTQAAKSAYPEQSAIVVQASFFDTGGSPWVPATIAYQVDDVGSGENLVPLTPVKTPASAVTVIITAGQNDMVSDVFPWEEHRVLFKFTDAEGQSYFKGCEFYLRRLFPVPGITGATIGV